MANSEARRFNYYISEILPHATAYDFADKETAIGQHITYMIDRLSSMFKWTGLPDTVPQRSLELYLMISGHCAFTNVDGAFYVFFGGIGGEPDVYYMPTTYVVANPALNLSRTFNIDKDCIVIPNDTMYLGLMPMLTKYGTMLAESELTLDMDNINTRIFDLITTPDDRTKAAAEEFLKQVRSGKLGVIADNKFLEGITTQPYGTGRDQSLTNIIEMIQYVKASEFNELGLNANYNMKRESLNTTESQMNNDALMPLIDDMLNCRKRACEKINAMYGLNIDVEFASAWRDNIIEQRAEIAEMIGATDVADDVEPDEIPVDDGGVDDEQNA